MKVLIISFSFKTTPVLNNHVAAIHGSERDYACDVCGKRFKTSPQLAGHKQSHTRNHFCTVCNRRFASLYVLKRHQSTHDNNTKAGKALKYECNVCGASFVRNLVKMYEAHMLEHNVVVNLRKRKLPNSDDYKCAMCPMKCINAKQLHEHIENVHLLAM